MKDFKSEYMSLKNQGLTDRSIAELLNIPYYTMTPLKSFHKIFKVERYRKNNNGITEEQFKRGLEIGLTRRLMNKRVRELGYSPEQACSFPNQCKGDKENGQMV